MKTFQLAYRAACMVGLLVGILQLPLWSPLLAQTGAGAIQGTVKDPSGAAIPAAKIKIVHSTTSTVRKAETNEVGFYTLPAAQIGRYQFTVQSPGMMTWKADLEVITGQTSTLDVALQVGTSAAEVTVTGSATSLVVDTSPTVAEVVEQSRIEQLPMNGRDINTLMNATTPGAEDTRINGMMGAALEIVQDGTVLRNLDTASISGRPPGLDTVQEFRVETSVSSARFDRPATAILSSKSGTNGVHGSVFETARNSSIGVARRRQDFFSTAPHLVRNEFGASVGGSVILPKLYDGRNKTFFFVAYEGLRLSQAQTAPTTVFPNAWRQGDFSGVSPTVWAGNSPFTTPGRPKAKPTVGPARHM